MEVHLNYWDPLNLIWYATFCANNREYFDCPPNLFWGMHNALTLIAYFVFKTKASIYMPWCTGNHYDDVTMSGMASQITSLTIVYSTVYPGADQRKHQSPASLAFVWGIHRGPVNSPHKWPVTPKLFPFDDVLMLIKNQNNSLLCNIHWNSIVTSQLRICVRHHF